MTTDRADSVSRPLQMIRTEVDLRDLQRWMGSRQIEDSDLGMHCLLAECFGDLAPKPFRLIEPRSGWRGVLYGYTRAAAAALQEQGRICADPLQLRALSLDSLQSKAMPTEWRAGLQLGFETRVRPVIRQVSDAAERDVFQVEASRYPPDGMPETREQVYAQWLDRAFERLGGARLDPERTRLTSFRRVRSRFRLRGARVEGPDAVMRGVFSVEDPDAFGQLLARGLGRQRAYGYGMLLLRPARRS